MIFSRKSFDVRETERLLNHTRELKSRSKFQSKADVDAWIIDLLDEVSKESDLCLSSIVARPLYIIIWRLLEREAFLFDDEESHSPETLKEGVKLRERLKLTIAVLENEGVALSSFREALKAVLLGILAALPVNALSDPNPDGENEEPPALSGQVSLYSLTENLPLVLTKIFGTFCAADLAERGLFEDFRNQADRVICAASGVPWTERHTSKRKMLLPIDRAELPAHELCEIYTAGTVFAGFFETSVPVPVPNELRFEHTHILGGTGAGKTQALQYLIMDDLSRALDQKESVVVFDPDGTLIRTISETDYFEPLLLGHHTVFIDPSEGVRPVSLNLFDMEGLVDADVRTREAFENNTLELFEYFFDSLLGSELTGKQATLFRYVGQLLSIIPGANIHTFRELMEDGAPFRPFMAKLPATARTFFETRFFAPDLKATKTQVLSRLWGVLSNRGLDRCFSAKHSSLRFDDLLQDGSIIFVNTSLDYLGQEGSNIFGRMVLSMIGQALYRRAAIPSMQRTPVSIYLDEAEGMIDQTLIRLLAQVRKYKGAVTIAHQHLDQLAPNARAGILANTSIRLVSGVSAKDAATLAPEMRTKADFLLTQRKTDKTARFALFARNITETAVPFEVPLGFAESLDRLSPEDYAELLDWSRDRFGARVEAEPPFVPNTEPAIDAEPEPPPVAIPEQAPTVEAEEVPETATLPRNYQKTGGGGARHQAICQSIRELGETAGFRASIEEEVLDGLGRVDVILRKADASIAFEVSVTTTREHELMNVRKCLEAGFVDVVMVAALPRHLVSLERFIGAGLDAEQRSKVRYVLADDLARLFGGITPEKAEKVVRGWRVKTTTSRTAIPESMRQV